MADNEGEIAYVRDHWDSQAKGTNYLLAGHGAVLVGCLTVLKDANVPAALKGLTSVAFVSALGLLLAALACAAILIVRSMKIQNLRNKSPKVDEGLIVSGFKAFQVVSFLLFIVEMLMLAWRLMLS
jgi:hypothetical protein